MHESGEQRINLIKTEQHLKGSGKPWDKDSIKIVDSHCDIVSVCNVSPFTLLYITKIIYHHFWTLSQTYIRMNAASLSSQTVTQIPTEVESSHRRRLCIQNTKTNLSTMQASIGQGQYCSQACLLGLATDTHSNIDPACPNAAEHGRRHLRRSDFMSLIRVQLDSGSSSSCLALLDISGSRGSLYKVTLPSHGYVLLAKGVQQDDVPYLLNEANIYRRLAPIQGRYIPVYIGNTNLYHPLIVSGGQAQPTRIITRLLFVSYAGISMLACLNETNEEERTQRIEEGIKAIHALGVLHMDAFANNILWDKGSVRFIDFERSTTREKLEEEQERTNRSGRLEIDEQEWMCKGMKRIKKSGKLNLPEGRGKSLWEDKCEKEVWNAVLAANTWLSVVTKIY